MARLYPPLIAGTIPAFAKEESDTSFTIKIPFNMNRAVSQKEVYKMCLVLKSTQNSTFVFTNPVESSSIDFDEGEATFNITSSDLSGDVTIAPGIYYKAQICYKNNAGQNGYYSTVGIIKCVSKPQVYIDGLDSSSTNNFSSTYIGKYDISNSSDKSEKLYSYQFIIYDSDYNIYLDSGTIIHSGLGDDTNIDIQTDQYDVYQTPNNENTYYIQFITTSLNGLNISSPLYSLKDQSFATLTNLELSPVLNSDNAYIDVKLVSTNSSNIPTRNYRLSRASSSDGYQNWTILKNITLSGNTSSILSIYKDFLIEQGVYYVYAIESYNEYNLFSDKLIAEKIQADFEDCFLYDGERQLKIRYNPKISSFKTDLLETKIDTIGGKYPYIFRNGYTEYKEFPISGLISYLMDEENLFLNEDELEESQILISESQRNGTPGANKKIFITTSDGTYQSDSAYTRKIETNQTADNVFSERYFKLKVLDWLNNGKAKIFKSPAEGNYLVRLIDVSLTPEDTISRMLHTFSATAYEIGEYKYTTLKDYDFINDTIVYPAITGYKSILLSDFTLAANEWITLFSGDDAGDVVGFNATDFPFGTYLKVSLKNSSDQMYILTRDFEITYDDDSIESIQAYFLNVTNTDGTLTYQIQSKFLMSSPDYFDLQKNVNSETVIGQSFIFKDYLYENKSFRSVSSQISLLDIIQNDSLFAKGSENENYYKFELTDLYMIKLRLRPSYIAYYNSDDGKYYQIVKYDDDGNIKAYEDEWNFDALYAEEPLAKVVVKNEDDEWWYKTSIDKEYVFESPFEDDQDIYCYAKKPGYAWSDLASEKTTWDNLPSNQDTWSELSGESESTASSSIGTKIPNTDKEEHQQLNDQIFLDSLYTLYFNDGTSTSKYLAYDNEVTLLDLSDVADFEFGKNIVVEIYYRIKIPEFGFEDTNDLVIKAVKNYKLQYIYEKNNNNILKGYPDIESDEDEEPLIWNARHKTQGLKQYFNEYIKTLSYAYGLIQNTVSLKNAPIIEDWTSPDEEET